MRRNTKGRVLRSTLATSGAFALALLGLTVLSAPASAASTVGNVPEGPYTLTITKLQNPETGPISNDGGNQQSTDGLTPIPGVDYTIAPVNGVDLSTAAGWQTASHLTVNSQGVVTDPNDNVYTVGTETTLPSTNADGVTTYTTNDEAVYLVTEASAPGSVIAVAPPFLVTLPLPNNNAWLTNVFVYPKNTVASAPTKTVDDSSAHGLGQQVNWTIHSTVPSFAPPASLTSYVVKDALDSRLALTATSDVTATLNGTAVPANDYAVAVDATNHVSVTFTQAGIELLAQNPGGALAVLIPTTVTSVGSGTIQNTPVVSVNGDDFTGPPAQTTWGSLQLKKVDAANPGNALAGAVFQIFTSENDAKNLSNPVSVNGSTSFTSASDGLVTVAGLKAQNNGTGANLTYYIVEVTPPTGFQVAPGFAQSNGGSAVTVAPGGIDNNPQIVVADPQVPPLSLPLTGSTGTVLFATSGAALIAIALGVAIVIARRKRHSATSPDAGKATSLT